MRERPELDPGPSERAGDGPVDGSIDGPGDGSIGRSIDGGPRAGAEQVAGQVAGLVRGAELVHGALRVRVITLCAPRVRRARSFSFCAPSTG